MDSFELNKIIGAILGTLLFVMGVGFVAEAIYHPIEGRGPGYELPLPEGTTEVATEEETAPVDIGTLLASANVQQGEAAARRCVGCHNFEQGSGTKQGPELYNIVGFPIAGHEGFAYSDALAALAGQTWTYENLDHFLLAPRGFAPGTKMNFGGLRDDQERANVIAYLASISPDAPPFPAPVTADAEELGLPEEAIAESASDAIAVEPQAMEAVTVEQDETPVVGTPTTETAPGGSEIVPEVATP